MGKYQILFPDLVAPSEEWHTSDALLFEALEAIGQIHSIKNGPFDSYPETWSAPSGRTIPLGDVYAMHEVLIAALAPLESLSAEELQEIGWRMQRICIRALGESWDSYANVLPQRYEFSDERFLKATRKIAGEAVLDFIHDFPSLAVYAQGTSKTVYVDRRFKRNWKLSDSREIDVIPSLMMHEVVEKALYDSIPLTARRFQCFHQIAQRLEQEAVEIDGIPWAEYQDGIMEPAIQMLADAPAIALPLDADTRPVVDGGDEQLAEALRGATKHNGSLFSYEEIRPQLYHLVFPDGKRMAETMMRFQEFYESPEFKGKHFTYEEFNSWYPSAHGGKTYVENWASEGFNLPSSALTAFYDGWFNPLTADEAEFLRFFNDKRNDRFYVIATADDSSTSVLGHELAHGLYFLNEEYKREVDTLLAEIEVKPLMDFLASHPEYGYHPDVLTDEAQAYLAHSIDDLEKHGFRTAPYAEISKKLKDVYERFA